MNHGPSSIGNRITMSKPSTQITFPWRKDHGPSEIGSDRQNQITLPLSKPMPPCLWNNNKNKNNEVRSDFIEQKRGGLVFRPAPTTLLT